jgi:hypothetical protein
LALLKLECAGATTIRVRMARIGAAMLGNTRSAKTMLAMHHPKHRGIRSTSF